MQNRSLDSKYSSALKISLIFLALAAVYIVFSDKIILQIMGSSVSAEKLNAVQSFKGLGFVFATSILLFILIQREINRERNYIKKLKTQKIELEKLSEEKTEAGQKFEALFKYNPTAIVITRFKDGIILDVNDAYSRLLGYTHDELIGKTTTDISVWKDKNDRDRIIKALLKDSHVHGFEAQVVCKNGKLIDTLSFLRILELPQEKVIITIILDITELKEKEKKIKDNEQRFRAIFENSLTAIVVADDTGNYLSVNKAAEEILGYSKDELLNMKVGDLKTFIPEDPGVRYQNYLRKNRETGEFNFIKKNGEKTTVLYNAVRLSKDFNLSIMMDITKNKKNEKELEASKTLMEKTLNSLNEAVIVVDPADREIKFANMAVEKIFGYTPEEIIGQQTSILHLNREMFEKFGKIGEPILEESGIFQTDFQMKHKNGAIIETENTVTTITEKDGWKTGVISIIRDISIRKNAQRQIEEYQDSLKQLTTELSLSEEKQRKEISANIHDHISQLLVISRMKLNDISEVLKSEELKKEISVISDHISEALANSRKITYDLSPPVLYELGLVETIHWLADKVKEDYGLNVQFTTGLEEIELPEHKLILIFRIIQELVNNVIKHAQAQNLSIEFIHKNGRLIIILKDDGVGFLTDGISSIKLKKDGFGLFTVKERVNNLGGEFSINSEINNGTQIKIKVPLNENL